MRTKNTWFNRWVAMAIAVYIIDINVAWYNHPANNITWLKYSLLITSGILGLLLVRTVLRKRQK